MALTLAVQEIDVWGKHRVAFATGTPAASDYPTAGYALSAEDFGFGANATILKVNASANSASGDVTTAPVLNFNNTTGKLQAFVTGAAATDMLEEAASGFDLSAYVLEIEVIASNK